MHNILEWYYFIENECRREQEEERIKKLEKEARKLEERLEKMKKEKKDND